MENKPIEENLAILKYGYLTRNGDYLFYSIVSQTMQRAFAYIETLFPESQFQETQTIWAYEKDIFT